MRFTNFYMKLLRNWKKGNILKKNSVSLVGTQEHQMPNIRKMCSSQQDQAKTKNFLHYEINEWANCRQNQNQSSGNHNSFFAYILTEKKTGTKKINKTMKIIATFHFKITNM